MAFFEKRQEKDPPPVMLVANQGRNRKHLHGLTRGKLHALPETTERGPSTNFQHRCTKDTGLPGTA